MTVRDGDNERMDSLADSSSSTRDYRDHTRTWGHDIGFEPLRGNRLRAHGWGELRDGDYLLLSNPAGGEARYRAVEVRRPPVGPDDQWFATLEFAPRERP